MPARETSGTINISRSFRAVSAAPALSLVSTGCVALMRVGAARGAGLFGVYKGTEALTNRDLGNDDRLRYLSVASIRTTSQDIVSVSDKGRHGPILHWVATKRDGRRLSRELAEGSAICSPADR